MPGQRFVALDVQPPPRAYFRDDLGNISALVDFGRLDAGQTVHAKIAATMWAADRRMVVNPDLVTEALTSTETAYTREFHSIAVGDNSMVKTFVEKAVGTETNDYWRARLVHDALCHTVHYHEPAVESVSGVLGEGYGVCRNYSAAMETFGRELGIPMLDSWAPRHETTFLMLPGLTPAITEVTEDALSTNTSPAWERSRWFLGVPAQEITTGVRGFAMHTKVLLDGTPFRYEWHCWLPDSVQGVSQRGWWSVINPETGRARRL
jgi:hypothetical protein